MLSQRLYQALGFACGFVLIIYGFNLLSIGLPGAEALTSQFLAANVLLGASALVFVSLYYLLKPSAPTPPTAPSIPVGSRPDIGIELIVEEETPPKLGFYKTIQYIGYFFTILGLVSAAHLVLQVFIRSTYNQALWWVEVLLVTFGVLSYTIFGSVGRLGLQEESKLAALATPSTKEPVPEPIASSVVPQPTYVLEAMPALTLNLAKFTRNSTGEYEKHLVNESYDMFRVDADLVTVWREDRRGMRSNYLAGPYELSKRMLEDSLSSGQGLTVGNLTLTSDTIRNLLDLIEKLAESKAASVSV